jgi:hypothetical protein
MTGEQRYFALAAAVWALVLMLTLGAPFGSSRFFLGHLLPHLVDDFN